MPLIVRVAATASLLVAVTTGAFFLANRLLRPSSSFLVVEETTLVVLGRSTEVLHPDGTTTVAATDLTLHTSDRVRTGPDSYGAITHVDGSTTTLDPGSEVTLRRLDMGPSGVGSISIHVQRGAIWNRMERLVDTSTNFEVTTDAATIAARRATFRVRVDQTGRTLVESMLDSVEVEGAVGMVTLEPGFQTIVDPGREPSPPTAAAAPRFALWVDVQGPVRPFLTDAQHRSIGFHPDADVYISQVTGATYSMAGRVPEDYRRLDVPEPSETYRLLVKGQGQGGAYTVSVAALVEGKLVAGADGLVQASGSIAGGGIQGIELQVHRPTVQLRGSFEHQTGAPPDSRAAVVQRQLRTSARAVETAAVLALPTWTAAPTATQTATPAPSPTIPLPSPTADPRLPLATARPIEATARVVATTAAPTRLPDGPTPGLSSTPTARATPAVVTVIPPTSTTPSTNGPPPTAAPPTGAPPSTSTPGGPVIVTPVPTAVIVTAVPPTDQSAATPRPTVALPSPPGAPVTSLPIPPPAATAAFATIEVPRPTPTIPPAPPTPVPTALPPIIVP